MKFPWKSVIGAVGVTAAIAWSVHGVRFKEVLSIVHNMNGWLLMTVFCLTNLNLLVRARTWKSVIDPIKPITLGHAFESYIIGVFSNLFLPFKLGDMMQVYTLGRNEDISKISGISAMIITRIFEITSLILLMSVIAALFSFPLLLKRRTVIIGAIILFLIGMLFVSFNKREEILAWIERVLSRFSAGTAQRAGKYFELFLEGTTAIHHLPDIVKILGFSLISWVVQICMVMLTAWALEIKINIIASGVVLLAINLGLTLPTPGNIGTFQVFSIIALSWFSVSKSKALTFSVIFQVIQGVPVLIGGGLFLLNQIFKTKQKNFQAPHYTGSVKAQ